MSPETATAPHQPFLNPDDVRKHAKRLKKGDPLREVAGALARRAFYEITDTELLLAALEDKSERGWRRRLIAADAIAFARRTEEQDARAERVLVHLMNNRHITKGQRLIRGLGHIALTLGQLGLAFGAAWKLLRWADARYIERYLRGLSPVPYATFMYIAVGCLIPLSVVLPTALIWKPLLLRARRDHLVETCSHTLGTVGSIEVIPHLAAATAIENNSASWRSLKHRLPEVISEEMGLWSPDQLGSMCQCLEWSADRDLDVLILRALRNTGSPHAITSIAKVMKENRSPEVTAEAEATLEILRQRKLEAQLASRLLRPSAAPEESHLLRPAGAPEAPSELLLRPVESE